MKERIIIYADEGKILTNGTTYGTQIFLAEGESPEDYHEISKEEYESLTAEKPEEETLGTEV